MTPRPTVNSKGSLLLAAAKDGWKGKCVGSYTGNEINLGLMYLKKVSLASGKTMEEEHV